MYAPPGDRRQQLWRASSFRSQILFISCIALASWSEVEAVANVGGRFSRWYKVSADVWTGSEKSSMPDRPEGFWSFAAPFFAQVSRQRGKAGRLQAGLQPLSQPQLNLTAVTGSEAEHMQALQQESSGLSGRWR